MRIFNLIRLDIWFKFPRVTIILLFFSLSFVLHGDVSIRIANLKQDMELVTRELAGLRTEVELLRRENAQLKIQLEQTVKKRNLLDGASNSSLQELGDRLQAFEIRLSKNEKVQMALQKTVESRLNELISQMNKGFAQVQSSNTPEAPLPTFNQDYPQKGFVHKVEKGQTVSSIAQKYGSKTQWIINANQIVDPKKVFVGKELFVPQK